MRKTAGIEVPGRDLTVDTLRGVACVLLVMLHVIGHSSTAGIKVSDDSVYRWFAETFIYVRMPLFSFLAGLVYAWRPVTRTDTYLSFMGTKARRLLIPFIVFIPAIGIAQTVVPDSNNPTALRWYEWLLFPLSPYWFLIAAFWIFLVVVFGDARGWLRNRNVVITVIVVVASADILIPAPDRTYELLGLRSALFLLTFFLVGLASSRFSWSTAGTKTKLCVAAGTIVLFAYTQLGLFELVPRVNGRHDVIGTLLGIGACLSLRALGYKSRALAIIGSFSAGIFLVHPFAIAGTRALLLRLGIDSTELLFIAGTSVGIGGSMLVVMVAQRYSFGRLILGERVNRAKSKTAATTES